jgi:nitrogen regulatory protein PII
MINISLLFIITDEGHDKKVKSILNSFGIKVKTVSNANGTASPSVLDYFGLIERKKAVFMAIIPNYLSKDILNKLNNHFKFDDVGTGVSFTVPISSSNKYLSDVFKNNAPESEEKHMEQENNIKYHLVITIVSEGYLEQVMTAAKRAGSSGGTALKGRGLSDSRPAKILGFNIEPEKDIVLNIVTDRDKKRVMEEITKEVGIKTRGKGVCISVPVEDAVGFGLIS